jgi:hypothetical protein
MHIGFQPTGNFDRMIALRISEHPDLAVDLRQATAKAGAQRS